MTALALAVLALAAGEVTQELSLREELRVGSGLAVGGPPAEVSATEALVPTGGLVWTSGGNTLSAVYKPLLQLPDFPNLGASGFEVLHAARVVDDYRPHGGGLHLGGSEDFQYGSSDLFALTQVSAMAPQIQALPAVVALTYVASTTLAHLAEPLAPRLALDVSAGCQVSGGADASSRAQLPLQWGPLATVRLDDRLTRLDTFSGALSLSGAEFSGGEGVWQMQATAGLTRRLSRNWTGTAELGWSLLTFQQSAVQPVDLFTFPVVRASVAQSRTFGRAASLKLLVASELAPYIDRILATGYEHLQIYGSVEGTVAREFGGGVQGGWTDPLADAGASTNLAPGGAAGAAPVETLSARIFYAPVQALRFEVGSLQVWQQAPVGGAVWQWVTFAAVVVKEAGRW